LRTGVVRLWCAPAAIFQFRLGGEPVDEPTIAVLRADVAFWWKQTMAALAAATTDG
jgi:hypothetical protein